MGISVISQDGVDMGSVKDLEIEDSAWQVTGLLVKLNKDILERLNMKRPMIGTQEIMISTTDVSGIADNIVLRRPLESYKAAETGTG